MVNPITAQKKRRYEALRYLYQNPLSNKELLTMVDMDQRELLTATNSLLKYGAIRKEAQVTKIEFDEANKQSESAIIGNNDGKKVTRYVMTERGLNLLAFYEYITEAGKYITFPPLFESEDYRKDMWERIQKNSYFKETYDSLHLG